MGIDPYPRGCRSLTRSRALPAVVTTPRELDLEAALTAGRVPDVESTASAVQPAPGAGDLQGPAHLRGAPQAERGAVSTSVPVSGIS